MTSTNSLVVLKSCKRTWKYQRNAIRDRAGIYYPETKTKERVGIMPIQIHSKTAVNPAQYYKIRWNQREEKKKMMKTNSESKSPPTRALKLCVLAKKGPRKVNQLTNILKHLVDNRAFYDQITTRLVL